MIELIKFFRILFLSKNLSRERLKDFTEDHISRLTAHNPGGIFTAILTAVTTAYNNYFGDLSSESLNIAVQKGKTTAMNESRTNLETYLSDGQKLIAYTYRNNRSTYEEFFPQGMDEYYQADLPTLETISDRFKTVLGNHSGDFTSGFVTDYNTVQGLFITNRNAQHTAMSDVSAERSDIETTKPALALQLTKNLLTIGLQYVGDESKCDVYFSQEIINAAFVESERKIETEINPATTDNVFDNIIKGTVKLSVTNTGSEDVYIGFVETASTPVPQVAEQKVSPGQVLGTNAAQAGWSTDKKFLNATNYSTNVTSYIVEKV